MATVSMVRIPKGPSAVGAGGGDPELTSLSQSHQGTKFSGGTIPYWGRAIPFVKTSSGSRARGPACWILLGTYSLFYIGSVKLEKLKSFYLVCIYSWPMDTDNMAVRAWGRAGVC